MRTRLLIMLCLVSLCASGCFADTRPESSDAPPDTSDPEARLICQGHWVADEVTIDGLGELRNLSAEHVEADKLIPVAHSESDLSVYAFDDSIGRGIVVDVNFHRRIEALASSGEAIRQANPDGVRNPDLLTALATKSIDAPAGSMGEPVVATDVTLVATSGADGSVWLYVSLELPRRPVEIAAHLVREYQYCSEPGSGGGGDPHSADGWVGLLAILASAF